MSLALVVDPDVELRADVRAKLRSGLARMVLAAALHDGGRNYHVVLRLCNDVAMRELNRGWRGKDKPTDVLAFAQREAYEHAGPPAGVAEPDALGDLVISVQTARRQASHGVTAELLHLVSHGLCHLLGYDHRDDAEERVMNARAAALRAEAARKGKLRPA